MPPNSTNSLMESTPGAAAPYLRMQAPPAATMTSNYLKPRRSRKPEQSMRLKFSQGPRCWRPWCPATMA
jgi:hypothetical protein